VRDSKDLVTARSFEFTRVEWEGFLAGVQRRAFDLRDPVMSAGQIRPGETRAILSRDRPLRGTRLEDRSGGRPVRVVERG
jgi:hypothetical protein